VNANEGFPLTELQVTACVFLSNYSVCLIAEGLTVCPFCRSFSVRLIVLPIQGFEVTHPIFKHVANIANRRVHQSRSLDVATEKCRVAAANNDDLLRQMAALTKKK